MKNPIQDRPDLLEKLTEAQAEVIRKYANGEGIKYFTNESWRTNYIYWNMDQDGWDDVCQEVFGDKLYTAMKLYWEITGEMPDPITIEALNKAEIDYFGEVVSC